MNGHKVRVEASVRKHGDVRFAGCDALEPPELAALADATIKPPGAHQRAAAMAAWRGEPRTAAIRCTRGKTSCHTPDVARPSMMCASHRAPTALPATEHAVLRRRQRFNAPFNGLGPVHGAMKAELVGHQRRKRAGVVDVDDGPRSE